jgi:hypothetical protein
VLSPHDLTSSEMRSSVFKLVFWLHSVLEFLLVWFLTVFRLDVTDLTQSNSISYDASFSWEFWLHFFGSFLNDEWYSSFDDRFLMFSFEP